MPLGPVADDVQHHHGFLHRLDVPSSGLILVAKTYSAYYDLQAPDGASLFERCRSYTVRLRHLNDFKYLKCRDYMTLHMANVQLSLNRVRVSDSHLWPIAAQWTGLNWHLDDLWHSWTDLNRCSWTRAASSGTTWLCVMVGCLPSKKLLQQFRSLRTLPGWYCGYCGCCGSTWVALGTKGVPFGELT